MEKKKITRVVFVIDRSGSMQGVMPGAIQAVKANIAAIRESIEGTDQEACVTLLMFDDVVEPLFFNRSVLTLDSFNDSLLRPRGQTALFDATAGAITMLRDAPVGLDEDVSYLLNVVTDGQENRSSKYDKSSLKLLMKSVQATDRWTLTFLVPPGDRNVLVNTFGLPDGNVMEWDSSTEGVKKYSTATTSAIKNYFVQRAAGKTSVSTFYADLSKVTIKDVKKNLADVTKDVKILNVDKDCTIEEFIRSKGYAYVKGNAYYELVAGKKRADKVQSYKGVFVVNKNDRSNKVYGGDAARQLLGLPDANVSLRPADHQNFWIFVQSTSVNRKLKAGTKVVYVKP